MSGLRAAVDTTWTDEGLKLCRSKLIKETVKRCEKNFSQKTYCVGMQTWLIMCV